jgi:type II secretory pathway pseudopilin PulG
MEFIVVTVMIGILSAAVMTNMQAGFRHSVTTQADQFRRNLSHIQMLAISRGSRLRLTVNATGTNYTVVSCDTSACSTTSSVTDPATGLNFSMNLTDGVTLAPTSNTLDFDSLGRPQAGGSLITTIPARTYTLSGSSRSVQVTVQPITGFAQASY